MSLNQVHFKLVNIVDILLFVFVFLAIVLGLIKAKKGFFLILLYAVSLVVHAAIVVLDAFFYMPLAKAMTTLLMMFLIVGLGVVYQSNFKIFYFKLSRANKKSKDLDSNITDEDLKHTVDEIVRACQSMSKNRIGALIVIAPSTIPSHILETGVELGAVTSTALLESIFNTRSPFHDGATIIKDTKVLAAGCFLPLSQSHVVARNLGTRHRAGIGITEETDMVTIIVSEETGIISIARKGEIRRFITPDRLRETLNQVYNISQSRGYLK